MARVKKFRFTVKPGEEDRLDSWLARKITGYSRSFLAGAIKSGQVWVEGRKVQPKTLVRAGQAIQAELILPSTEIIPEKIPLDIVYSDKDLAIINKPAGLVMHPAGRHKQGTLANALKSHFHDFYLVHRLDKDTSGVVMVALNLPAKNFLSGLFEKRKVKKTYLALVSGKLVPQTAYLDLPIKRGKSGKFESAAGGRSARSFYKVKEYLKGYTLVEVHPETGRTHQVRVHFKTLNHPIVGDEMYGVAVPGLSRQFLHAYKLEFHDKEGKLRSYVAPFPKDLTDFLKSVKK